MYRVAVVELILAKILHQKRPNEINRIRIRSILTLDKRAMLLTIRNETNQLINQIFI